MTTADYIQSIGLFITIIGLTITIFYNRKQLKMFNEQLKLNFFADYTKRYQEIILKFPESINQKNFDIRKMPENDRNEVLKYMRVYFNLCSEEYDLYTTNYISERVWENWKNSIESAFSKKAFIDAWYIIKLDTIYDSRFTIWINNEILNRTNKLGEELL